MYFEVRSAYTLKNPDSLLLLDRHLLIICFSALEGTMGIFFQRLLNLMVSEKNQDKVNYQDRPSDAKDEPVKIARYVIFQRVHYEFSCL